MKGESSGELQSPILSFFYSVLGAMLWVLFCTLTWTVVSFEVFIIPHSHCDAGWTSTFEVYYQQKVKLILNTVIDQMENHPYVFNWAGKFFNCEPPDVLQSQGFYTDGGSMVTSGDKT